MSNQHSNIELMKQIEEGSIQAFNELYQRYFHFVMHICLAIVKDEMEAEEVCHDVFLEIIRKAGHYHRERGSVEAWIAIIAKSRSKDFLRKKRRKERFTLLKLEEEDTITPLSPEAVALQNMEREELIAAVLALPKNQKQALWATYFQYKSHTELAFDLNAPLGTVKSWVRYGIQNLRKQLYKKGLYEGKEESL